MAVRRFIIGLALSALAIAVVSPPAAKAMFVVVFALVPSLVADGRLPTGRLALPPPVISWAAMFFAIPLLIAYAMPVGTEAAILSLPWVVLTGACAAVAVIDGLRGLPSIFHPSSAGRLLADASLVLLAVGAIFALLDRSAIEVLGLEPGIVLVTAVHFHVLGLGLVGLSAALAARGSAPAVAAGYLFLVGIPVTAAGFTFGSTLLQWLGSIPVVTAGLLIALALVRSARGMAGWRSRAFVASAGCLVVGVPMGLLWSSAVLFGFAFVDFGTMVAVHGVLNTIGTTAAVIAAVDAP